MIAGSLGGLQTTAFIGIWLTHMSVITMGWLACSQKTGGCCFLIGSILETVILCSAGMRSCI